METKEEDLPISLFVILFATLMLLVLSFTMTSLASPYIVSDLGGDRTITFYALSFFGFGTAITIPLAKPLASKFGAAKTCIASLFFFTFLNLASSLVPTYFLLILFRFLTGLSVGPCYPLINQFLGSLAPSHKKVVVNWIFITILVVTPIFGACIGGVIAYLYDWRLFFFINSTIAFTLTLLLTSHIDRLVVKCRGAHFDWIGWIFYAVAIACLTFAITTSQQLDWYRSPLFVTALLIGIPCFGYYLLRSFFHPSPVFDLKLLTKPSFALGILSLMTLFAVYFGIILLLAIWLTLDVRFTPLWIAALLAVMAAGGFFPRFILEGKIIKLDPRIFIAIATLLLAISCFYTTIFNTEINFGRIVFSRAIAGIGLALFLPSTVQLLTQSWPAEKGIDVFEFFQGMRNLASGLGAAVFSIVWQRRTVFYYERLNEGLNLQSYSLQTFFHQIEVLQVPGDPLAILNTFLSDQASALALEDLFFLMGWILVGLFIIIIASFFLKGMKLQKIT